LLQTCSLRLGFVGQAFYCHTRQFLTTACVHQLCAHPIWLVPIADSTGNTDANARLSHHIARFVPGAQIAKAIYRTQPVQSQCARHKLALGPIPPEQHHLARTRKALTLRQTYFVDNVTTSGNTLEAARAALGFGAGLVFADAAPRKGVGSQYCQLRPSVALSRHGEKAAGAI
jgi:hypothetical protein